MPAASIGVRPFLSGRTRSVEVIACAQAAVYLMVHPPEVAPTAGREPASWPGPGPEAGALAEPTGEPMAGPTAQPMAERVIAVLARDAVRLPLGIVVAAASDELPFAGLRVGDRGEVGHGILQLGALSLRPARWWDPRVPSLPGLRARTLNDSGPDSGPDSDSGPGPGSGPGSGPGRPAPGLPTQASLCLAPGSSLRFTLPTQPAERAPAPDVPSGPGPSSADRSRVPPSRSVGLGSGSADARRGTLPPELIGPTDRLAVALAGADIAELPTAVSALVGLGPGSTPAGDDVLAGALVALAAAGDEPRRARLAQAVRPRLAATPVLSGALLAQAARGHAIPQVTHLLRALAAGTDPGPALAALDRVGHTSGPALAYGVDLALRALAGRTAREVA